MVVSGIKPPFVLPRSGMVNQLQEETEIYLVNSDSKKDDKGAKNIYSWDINP